MCVCERENSKSQYRYRWSGAVMSTTERKSGGLPSSYICKWEIFIYIEDSNRTVRARFRGGLLSCSRISASRVLPLSWRPLNNENACSAASRVYTEEKFESECVCGRKYVGEVSVCEWVYLKTLYAAVATVLLGALMTWTSPWGATELAYLRKSL